MDSVGYNFATCGEWRRHFGSTIAEPHLYLDRVVCSESLHGIRSRKGCIIQSVENLNFLNCHNLWFKVPNMIPDQSAKL